MRNRSDINARTQDKLRSGIKAAEIIKALSAHILSGLKMTNTQVRAAEILLRKVSPDLLATAISDDRSQALPVLQIVRADPAKGSSGPPRSELVAAPGPADQAGSADTAA